MNATALPMLPRTYWIIAVLALLWNLLGLAMFAMQATLSPEALAAMPSAQREIATATPSWVNVAFALAVIGGVFGAVGLLMRRRWAVAMFAVSLGALAVQVLGIYLVTPAWSVAGPSSLGMPALLIVIAVALLAYARHAAGRRWLG